MHCGAAHPPSDVRKLCQLLQLDICKSDTCTPSPYEGFHSASHPAIDFSACCCTASTVGSTFAFAVDRSEQWNPSESASGWSGVLAKCVPSAASVASLHGSPVKGETRHGERGGDGART